MSTALSHRPADVVRWLLIALGQGSDPTQLSSKGVPSGLWPIYVNAEPNAPDNCITLYDTDQVDFGRSMIDGESFQHYGIQLRVRSSDDKTGGAKIEAMRVFINEQIYERHVTVDGHDYEVQSVFATGVLTLGMDNPNSKRMLYTSNLSAVLKANS